MTCEPLKFTLPVPPSTNNLYLTMRGRRVLSPVAREYKEAARLIMKQPKLIGGEVELDLKIFRAHKRGDLSNRIKLLEDCLTNSVIEDDSQVYKITVERFEDKWNPRIEIEIRERVSSAAQNHKS